MTKMVAVTQADANNYCRVLAALGMEEEGDPVAEIERLRSELANIRDANPLNWDAPHNDTATFMEWAKSRARFALSPAPVPDNAVMRGGEAIPLD